VLKISSQSVAVVSNDLSQQVDDGPSTSEERNGISGAQVHSVQGPQGSQLFKMLEGQQRPAAAPAPRSTPQNVNNRRADGVSITRLSGMSRAGTLSGLLAGMLRKENRACLQFTGGRSMIKACKVLAICQDNLNQHASGLSFVPILLEHKLQQTADTHDEEASTSYNPSGHLDMRMHFQVDIWRRAKLAKELEMARYPLYEFALDVRQSRKNKASVAEDLMFTMSDLFYGNITMPDQAVGPSGMPPSFSTPSQVPHVPPPAPAAEQPTARSAAHGQAVSNPTTFIVSADMSQLATVFAGMSLTERRLRQEGHPLQLVCTVYSNSAAPRVDGRSGFIFKIAGEPYGADRKMQRQQRAGRGKQQQRRPDSQNARTDAGSNRGSSGQAERGGRAPGTGTNAQVEVVHSSPAPVKEVAAPPAVAQPV